MHFFSNVQWPEIRVRRHLEDGTWTLVAGAGVPIAPEHIGQNDYKHIHVWESPKVVFWGASFGCILNALDY